MSDGGRHRRKLFLIGTHHNYQYGVGSSYGDGCSLDEESAFRRLVDSAARKLAVRALAEELNEDGLTEHGVQRSVLQQQAAALELQHCFCEPGRAERAALGIHSRTNVRSTALMRGWAEEEVTRRQLAEFRKRESVWCDRLLRLNTWPVLFVCGADHVSSFSFLLLERGLEVQVLESCWEATQ
jgi:hypothetical protein